MESAELASNYSQFDNSVDDFENDETEQEAIKLIQS